MSVTTETFTPDNLIAGGGIVTDTGTLLSGETAANTVRGRILGKITVGTLTAAAGTNTGNGTISAVTAGTQTQVGVYTLICTAAASNAGTFQVKAPDGSLLPPLTVAVAYTGNHINLTVADGSADWIVGDSITVTVAAGSGKLRECKSANVDGSNQPYAILAETTDASGADATCPIYLAGEFTQSAVSAGTGHTVAGLRDTLRGLGIYLKSSSTNP
jgi:hypothetical protein